MIVFLCENIAGDFEEVTSRPPRGSQSAICSVMLVSVWGDQSAVEPMTSSGRAVLDAAMQTATLQSSVREKPLCTRRNEPPLSLNLPFLLSRACLGNHKSAFIANLS
jgi:hypothetical protein